MDSVAVADTSKIELLINYIDVKDGNCMLRPELKKAWNRFLSRELEPYVEEILDNFDEFLVGSGVVLTEEDADVLVDELGTKLYSIGE